MMNSVVAVSASSGHTFSKPNVPSIRLIAGVGVEGDAHSGKLVKHRYLVRRDQTQPNLRQVHLIHQELFTLVAEHGHRVAAGEQSENVTTKGIDLLSLPKGAVLRIGPDAAIELTGLRNPCVQIDEFQDGLMTLLRHRDSDGNIVRLGGVMAVVRSRTSWTHTNPDGPALTGRSPPQVPRKSAAAVMRMRDDSRRPESRGELAQEAST